MTLLSSVLLKSRRESRGRGLVSMTGSNMYLSYPRSMDQNLVTGLLSCREGCGAEGTNTWFRGACSIVCATPRNPSESHPPYLGQVLMDIGLQFHILIQFCLFFVNSSTMGLSVTVMVMALLLSGKHLFTLSSPRSFHHFSAPASSSLRLGCFYSPLVLHCEMLQAKGLLQKKEAL